MTATATPSALEVRPLAHEKYTYEVTSATHPGIVYTINVLGANGGSSCNCSDWHFRRSPAIRKGQPLGTSATLCRHTKAVRDYFLNEIILGLMKVEKEEST